MKLACCSACAISTCILAVFLSALANFFCSRIAFFNADSAKQREREIAVRSSSNSPSDQLGNQGYDQFGNFLGGTDAGSQIENQTNTGYNERMPIYKLGGKTYYALGGELYDADADYDLTDDDIEALRKIGYSVKKN